MDNDVASAVSRSTLVAAAPDRVWELVSDLPGMGRFSPENRGGSWAPGTTGPAVGAVFRGRNRQGWRRWGTRAVVVECEPGRSFAFEVSYGPLRVALWRYDLEPTDGGCRLTETWIDRRGRFLLAVGGVFTGVTDRRAYTATSIEATLRQVQAAAETPAGAA